MECEEDDEDSWLAPNSPATASTVSCSTDGSCCQTPFIPVRLRVSCLPTQRPGPTELFGFRTPRALTADVHIPLWELQLHVMAEAAACLPERIFKRFSKKALAPPIVQQGTAARDSWVTTFLAWPKQCPPETQDHSWEVVGGSTPPL